MTVPASSEVQMRAARLRGALLRPGVSIGVAELRSTWRFRAVRIVAKRMHDFDTWPELPVRIRGAFGRALHRRRPVADRRGRVQMPAVAGLFDHSGWIGAGPEIAKPFVLRAWPEDGHLIVELRLFGIADQWLDEAVPALVEALEVGIAPKAERSFRVPLPVRDVLVSARGGLDAPEPASSAVLKFRSPVAVRRDARHVFDPLSVLASVVKRVESLAPWQLAGLDHDRSLLRHDLDDLVVDERDMTPYRWERHSRNGGDRPIGIAGQIGSLRVSGRLGRLLDHLVIAETCNTGSHAALGLGWFDLILYP
jgi:hypothetical protein